MGWWLTAAEELPTTTPDHSVTTALIAALGAALVALITIGLPLLFRQSRQVDQPAQAPIDPKVGETVAVVASKQLDDRRTLAQLDRHVDGIGDQVDRLRWEMDDMRGWRDQHDRRHGNE